MSSIFVVLLLVIGQLYFGLRGLNHINKIKSFQVTQATNSSHGLVKDPSFSETKAILLLSYEFSVNGNHFKGTHMRVLGNKVTKRQIEQSLRAYENQNGHILVYYNPNDPNQNLIYIPNTWHCELAIFGSVYSLILIALSFFFSLRKISIYPIVRKACSATGAIIPPLVFFGSPYFLEYSGYYPNNELISDFSVIVYGVASIFVGAIIGGAIYGLLNIKTKKDDDDLLSKEILCPNCGADLQLNENERREKTFTCSSCKETFRITD